MGASVYGLLRPGGDLQSLKALLILTHIMVILLLPVFHVCHHLLVGEGASLCLHLLSLSRA